MSSSSKEMKRRLQQQRVEEQAAMQQAQLEAQRLAAATTDFRGEKSELAEEEESSLLTSMSSGPQYELQSQDEEVESSLFDDFDQEFGAYKRKGGVLSFSSDEEADEFFKAQADKGRAFCFHRVGADLVAYSDGKGHYKHGSKQEVHDYCVENNIDSPFAKQFEEESSATASPRR